MGWVSGASLTAATSAAGGLRDPRRRHDDARRSCRRPVRGGEGAHRRALRRELPGRPARPRRAGRPSWSAEGVRLVSASPARPPRTPWPAATTPAWSSCPPSAPAATPRRCSRWASTPSSPRAARAAATPASVPTSLLLPQVVDAVGADDPGARRRRLPRRPRPRRRPGLRRRRHRHGHPLPAHPGEPRARRGEGSLHSRPRCSTPSSPPRSTARRSGSSAPTSSTASSGRRGCSRFPRAALGRAALPQGDRHAARRPRAGGRWP